MLKRNIFLNETGQMAVFVALIFQVLFVLFAMVINIGLIVHDKINLQNSVDLAAYYAASKQAESMNMIAHINYQMRQDYKLLAWRYRVLGSFGTDDPYHPAITQGGVLADTIYDPQDRATVCIAHNGWAESFGKDPVGNNCKSTALKIPDLKPLKYIPLSLGFNQTVIANFATARDIIAGNCAMFSPYNWGFATTLIIAYRLSITERKKQILKLATEMSKAEDFLDIEGNRVRDGALKTLRKNLTASNKAPDSFNDNDFELINGLAQGDCSQADEVGFPKWLVDIPIAPILRYTQLTVKSGSECNAETKSYDQLPALSTLAKVDPSGNLRLNSSEPEGKDIRRSSRGFEKNPWCLAYVGVKAKTKPRKPFAPFGEPITMEAKALAEPFGGRIGPWYGSRWPAQASESDGSDRTDKLAVPRGDFDPTYRALYLPNYSRFPGDTLGLKSSLALGLMRRAFSPAFFNTSTAGKFKLADYENIMKDFYTTGDPLSWSNNSLPTRRLEVAAVTPDLFDIAYYSIDPEFYRDYLLRAQKLFQGLTPMSDIGSRADVDRLKMQSVKQQFGPFFSENEFPDAQNAYYLARQWEHLLTGWMQGGVADFTSRGPAVAEKFGACAQIPEGQQPQIPGGCISGGRVGYSVRLVHKEYLFGEHELGGKGAGKDRIRNLPPSSF